jgi:hypothetical protein
MRHRISNATATALLGAAVALGSFAGVAAAQDVQAPPPADRFDDRGDGMDWGWIGLLGLGGLAGLMGREKRTTYHPQPSTGRV